MKKEDLKTGMVIEYRGGALRLVAGHRLYARCGFAEDTLYDLNYDYIVAVYNDFDKSKCLWKRVEIKKKDIINGTVVKLRNGNYYMKVDDILLNLKYGTHTSFSFDNSLKNSDSDFDIIEVDIDKKLTFKPYQRYLNGDTSEFIKINAE